MEREESVLDVIENDVIQEQQGETSSMKKEKKKKKILIIIICIVVALLAAGAVLYFVFGIGAPSKIENEYIKISQYKRLKIKAPKEVDSKAVNERIEQEMSKNKTSKTIKNRKTKVGDTVTVDYTGTIDGEEFDGGKASNVEIEITEDGSQYIEGFVEGIKGHSKGEEFDVPVTFPENYPEQSLAGKTANFHFKIKKIVVYKMPTLNDLYVVKHVKGCKTVKEYKEKIKSDLKKENKENIKNEKISLAMKALLKKTKVKEYPEKDIQKIVNKYVSSYTKYAEDGGTKLEDYLKENYNMTVKQFKKEVKNSAKSQVKQELVVDAIAKEEDLYISKSEYDKKMKELAKEYQFKTVKKFKEAYKDTMKEDDFKKYFVLRKVGEFVADHAVMK